jgi:hypothetical protein
MRLSTVGILILALTSVVACQAAHIPGFIIPMPATWGGPEVFELPRVKLRPDMVVTHTGVCTSADKVENSESRLIGVRRTDHGLIEARLEVDGSAVATVLYNDQGRVVHTKADEAASEDTQQLTESLAALLPEVEAVFYRPLTRNRPVSVRVPLRRVLPEAQAKSMPESVLRASMEITTQYLGQTEFDGARVAAYRMSGGTSPPIIMQGGDSTVTFRMQTDGLVYSDAAHGVILYSETKMVASGQQTGKPPVEMSVVCQQRLDRQKSSGL